MTTRKNRRPISTDKQAAALKAEGATYLVRIKNNPGLFCRVTPTGYKAFVAVARDRHGQQVWHTVGGVELNLDDAIEQGREVVRRIKAGLPPSNHRKPSRRLARKWRRNTSRATFWTPNTY